MSHQKPNHNALSGAVIGAAIDVHRELGPGKRELAYERALQVALTTRGLGCRAQVPVPVIYKGTKLDCGYRVDLLVEDELVVEGKSVEALAPVHRAQLLTQLRLLPRPVGLLINFHVPLLKDGVERFHRERLKSLYLLCVPSFLCGNNTVP
jgi:GxxExxY protein